MVDIRYNLRVKVRKEGVEPSRVAPYAPEAYAYASSATSAKFIVIKYSLLGLPCQIFKLFFRDDMPLAARIIRIK